MTHQEFARCYATLTALSGWTPDGESNMPWNSYDAVNPCVNTLKGCSFFLITASQGWWWRKAFFCCKMKMFAISRP